ncbi:nitrate reductase [Flammeovirga kamogawensis]|uniref:Molybdopterin-dependent oxidoreductase n=1 Tax=Flammeovirga kamogawensis TaxID=373891 RepID=A0ABX8GV30_9BACT|nr:nitrate reductase [Flammeovirga kamogawensis]MBB6461684.1 ferredoxin-nitrate reductase [Flammeovirga kamogawensis]QWG07391.1 molybdopterin-dependent oxidoreductase [Flammeovirga kamogawensis]TRX69204.1 molybdopterin-dependent oxidoreductase [Flammeovirga kamogawensis]
MKNCSTYKSTCSYCGVGCGINVNKDAKGKITVDGDPSYPVNKGKLCSKGMNLHYVVQDTSDRLLYPQMRWSSQHELQRVDWDTALTRASAVFKSIIKKHGPDAVGMYVSGQCLTEEYYLANKLTKGFFQTNNIDTNSRLCMSSAVVGYVKTLGEDTVPIAYDDIEHADTFMIAGANPAWCHPILFRRIEAHKEENPSTKIIVVDPRKTQSCAIADLHLQLNPGTDIVLYQAIGRAIIEEGDLDWEFIKNHTDGFDTYRKEVLARTLKEASAITGITIDKIKLAARYIGNAKGFINMWAMGLNQSAQGTNKNLALLNLNLITGQIGKVGAGPFSLTGQPNAMGGREVGGMASLLAAHHDLKNPDHRQKVADYWGVDHIQEKPGKTATEMFEALHSGEMKAIWIVCTNPMVSLPDSKFVEEALKKAKFVVVQDISNKADSIEHADLILPAAGWLEKEGTMTNSERRISHLESVIPAPGEALPDTEIFCRFAQKMGYHGFDYNSTEEIFKEHAVLTKGTNIDISELDYATLKEKRSVQWPYKNGKSTNRLFTDNQFFTPNKKAQIVCTGVENSSDSINTELPLILTTGRIRDQWHTMTRTGKVNKLNQHIPLPFLEMHPNDALTRGLKDGETAVIQTERGECRVNVNISSDIKQGVIFMPMHWGKISNQIFARTNNLTANKIDPISKEPDFKFSAAQVVKYQKAKEKILIIGAGAAAYRFIHTYRGINNEDEIEVFSKESTPFYNRVLLPEYVNETLLWKDLQKFNALDEFDELGVKVHLSKSILNIDRNKKVIVDQFGEEFSYDKLIIATGSRPFVPADVPIHMEGVFTMRNKKNADDLKQYLNKDGSVVIIGGGLLGLELAASLREININVTIVQLAGRLMDRQLDPIASELLLNHVEDKGIEVLLNDQVQTIEKSGSKTYKAKLKGGRTLESNAIVYAIGTRPNIELGKESGLKASRGLVVNEYLQTSDSSIFSIGEIAEFEEKMNGTTAGAEEQADVCARFISGDLLSRYTGTLPMNILKFSDLNLCSLGIIDVPRKDKSYEEVILLDKAEAFYKKCIIKDNKLVGTILLGDKSEFADYKKLIELKTELGDRRTELLRGKSDAEPLMGEVICSCGNVGSGNLQKAMDEGCTTLNTLCEKTGAGLGCGSCKTEIQEMLKVNDTLTV